MQPRSGMSSQHARSTGLIMVAHPFGYYDKLIIRLHMLFLKSLCKEHDSASFLENTVNHPKHLTSPRFLASLAQPQVLNTLATI